MSATIIGGSSAPVTNEPKDARIPSAARGRWWRFLLLAVITGVALVPIVAVVVLSLRPALGSTSTSALTLENFKHVFSQTGLSTWLGNSLAVTLITVVVAVVVAAPAGYVLSRAQNRLVSGYSLVLFIVQSLPVVTAVIPLFVLFAKINLVDSLTGVTIIYVGSTMSVATWMMAAYYNSIPIMLEEAAWMDGCSVLGSFVRIVLRNSLPGILSTAIFSFLLAWNDYLIAVVFLRSDPRYTLPLGLRDLLPAERDQLGSGHGGRRDHDAAAGPHLRGAEQVLQHRRHRWLTRRPVSRERLVVIGADAAGMSAASQARRLRGPGDLEIVAIERGSFTSYSACGIPYWIAGDVSSAEALVARTPEEFREKQAIDVHLHHEALEIDLDRREVVARDHRARADRRFGFDQVVVATGAVPVRPDLPGIGLDGVYGVQTLDDGAGVHAALDNGARRAVVVGAGYIGLEMAEALVRRGLEVTVVESGGAPMSTLDPDMGALITDAVRGMAIEVRLDDPVRAIEGERRVAAVVTDTARLPADIVVLGLGVRPNSDLAAAAGIACGPTGGIITDPRMHAPSVAGVWGAGDCVQSHHLVSHRPVHVALGTHANKQGRVAGINIGGGFATFPGVVGTAVTKICDLEIARTGLSSREADAAGLHAVAATVDSTTRAGYFPGAASITTKLIAEVGSGRLLGAQIVGREGAAKRIDVLATALWNSMSVEQMAGMDLSYAPPFAPVWDPVLIAARKAAQAVADAATTLESADG